MAANSAKESAPNRLSRPVTAHTESAASLVPIERVICAGTMKIPVPIMMPMTMAVASHPPSSRSNCGGAAGTTIVTGLGSGEFMGGIQPAPGRCLEPTSLATRMLRREARIVPGLPIEGGSNCRHFGSTC